MPSVTLSFNTIPNVTLGDIVKNLAKLAATVLPDGVQASLQGNAQQFQESEARMGWLLALPIALGCGAGGESRCPLGLAVVGGLLFSQTLTLYHPGFLSLHGKTAAVAGTSEKDTARQAK